MTTSATACWPTARCSNCPTTAATAVAAVARWRASSIDDSRPTLDRRPGASRSPGPYVDLGYRHDGDTGKGDASPPLPRPN